MVSGDPVNKGFGSEVGKVTKQGYDAPKPVTGGPEEKGSFFSGKEGIPSGAPSQLSLEKVDIPSASDVHGTLKEPDAPGIVREEDLDRERVGGKRKKEKPLKARRLAGNLLLGMDVQV